jgi:soluble lytic murein transglycosylase
VLAGTWYLKKVLRHYSQADDPLPFGLAEYNAGRGNVLKWLAGDGATNSAAFIGRIGFPGTRAYVQKIIQRYQDYRHVNPS